MPTGPASPVLSASYGLANNPRQQEQRVPGALKGTRDRHVNGRRSEGGSHANAERALSGRWIETRGGDEGEFGLLPTDDNRHLTAGCACTESRTSVSETMSRSPMRSS